MRGLGKRGICALRVGGGGGGGSGVIAEKGGVFNWWVTAREQGLFRYGVRHMKWACPFHTLVSWPSLLSA